MKHAPGKRLWPILVWILIATLFGVLAFVVIGPLAKNPSIDKILSTWREKYFTAVSFIAIVCAVGLTLRWDWIRYRETNDHWCLMRIVFYALGTLIVGGYFSWKAFLG